MKELVTRLTQFPTQFFLIVIGLLMFVPFLGSGLLFDWDEINFAEAAREMLITHNYRFAQINYQPFFEKPPFFIWLQAFSMSRFGVNEFAARLPNAICGVLTMIAVFNVGRKYFSSRLGVLWALLFACSFLPQIYFKSGIIDPVFNYFIFISIIFLFHISIADDFASARLNRSNHRWYLIASGLAAGLAILTKGPVAFGLIVLTITILLIWNKGRLNFSLADFLLWLAVVCSVLATWIIPEWKLHGSTFLSEFLKYQMRLLTTEDSGHGGPFYYHLPVLFWGCFPAAALALESFRRNTDDTFYQRSFKRWMIVLFAVVLLVFSVVKTKIIHYSSLCYFPITFLAAYYLHHLLEGRWRWTWRQTLALLLSGGLLFVAMMLLPILALRWDIIAPYLHDDFALEAIKGPVYWNKAECIYGAIALAALIATIVLMHTKHVRTGTYLLIIISGLATNATISQFMPRISRYSQGPMVAFLKAHRTENCQIEPAGFKSYAHLFYGERQPFSDKRYQEPNFVIYGPVERPVYFITKVNLLGRISFSERVEELYRKDGYVFLKRKY